jgi:hypothetical protein
MASNSFGYDPYGEAFNGYSAPRPRARRSSGGPYVGDVVEPSPVSAPYSGGHSAYPQLDQGYAAPRPFTGAPQLQAGRSQMPVPMAQVDMGAASPVSMSMDQMMRMRNQGNIARGPSPGSTVGRISNLAQNPYQGAVAARMPGNQQYADILGAGLAPQLQANRMGEQAITGAGIQNDIARTYSQAYPGQLQQQTRGMTIQNDNQAALGPAQVGLVNAQAGAVTAGQGTTPQMVNQLQAEVRRLQAENQQHRTQLERYQQQEAACGQADQRQPALLSTRRT